MSSDIISIIIPAYNAESFISEAITSCKNQTYKNVEIIVVDDGSTDRTTDIVRKFNDVKLITQCNQGAGAARNNGLMASTGYFIKFLDADDTLCPDALEEQYTMSKKLLDLEIIYGDYSEIKFGKKSIFKNYKVKYGTIEELARNDILISAPLHKKKYLLDIGGFDVRIKRGQEWNLHVRLAASGVRFVYYPTNVFYYIERENLSKISNIDKDLIKICEMREETLRLTFNGIKMSPETSKLHANALWGLGRLALREGESHLAYELFAKASSIDPNNCTYYQKKMYNYLLRFFGASGAEKIIKPIIYNAIFSWLNNLRLRNGFR